MPMICIRFSGGVGPNIEGRRPQGVPPTSAKGWVEGAGLGELVEDRSWSGKLPGGGGWGTAADGRGSHQTPRGMVGQGPASRGAHRSSQQEVSARGQAQRFTSIAAQGAGTRSFQLVRLLIQPRPFLSSDRKPPR